VSVLLSVIECLLFGTLVTLLGLIPQIQVLVVGVHTMASTDDASSVVTLLNIHLGVSANVEDAIGGFTSLASHLDCHHQIECLVSLLLAVLDAGFLLGLRGEEGF
jgi:hypothetical protein